MIQDTEYGENSRCRNCESNSRVGAQRQTHCRIPVVRESEANHIANDSMRNMHRREMRLGEPFRDEIDGIDNYERWPERSRFR